MQGDHSRAIFRLPAVSGHKYFTVLYLHISNIYAKKSGIAEKLILILCAIVIRQEVDLAAGDFNGTTWRYRSNDNLSTVCGAFMDCLAYATGPHCGDLDLSGQWGRRLRISQITWLSAILESVHHTESIWLETD